MKKNENQFSQLTTEELRKIEGGKKVIECYHDRGSGKGSRDWANAWYEHATNWKKY
jgi:bacteriocin-like protein